MEHEGPSLDQPGEKIPWDSLVFGEGMSRGRYRKIPKDQKIPTPMDVTLSRDEREGRQKKRKIRPIEEVEEIGEGREVKKRRLHSDEEIEGLSEKILDINLSETEGSLFQELPPEIKKLSAEVVAPEAEGGGPVPMELDFVDDLSFDDLMEIVDPADLIDPVAVEGGHVSAHGDKTSFLDNPIFDDAEMVDVEKLEQDEGPPIVAERKEEEGALKPLLPTTAESVVPEGLPEAQERGAAHPVLEPVEASVETTIPLPSASEVVVLQASGPKPAVMGVMEGYKQAAPYLEHGQYDRAYQLLLPLSRCSPDNQQLLIELAFCLAKMNRHKESLIIYRELGKRNPKEIFFKEMMADRLFAIGDFIRAQIIYKKLRTVYADRKSEFDEKIRKCQDQLRLPSGWDSFQSIYGSIGGSGGPLSQEQLLAIDRIHRQLVQKNNLMWDLFFLQTRKITPQYLRNHFTPVTLQCSDGRSFTAYKDQNFRFLAHFSSLVNSRAILDLEVLSQHDPTVREQVDYFWNSQYKVCASLLQFDGQTFMHGKGLGFLIDVPDPDRNILHAFVRDVWSPSYLRGKIGSAVTMSSSEELARGYNEFMPRYEVLSEYVYAVWQNADRVSRYTDLLKHITEVSDSLRQKSLFSWLAPVVNFLRSLVGIPNQNYAALENLLKKLKELTSSPDIDRIEGAQIVRLMEALEQFLAQSKQTEQKARMHQEIAVSKSELQDTLRVLPEIVASSNPFSSKKNFLILDYVDRTISIVRKLLAANPMMEASLFEKILHRKAVPGEHLVPHLQEMRNSLESYVQQGVPKISKGNAEHADRALFCRPLSPAEVSTGTEYGKYNEVGVRSHFSSYEVGAMGASFKAVVVEQRSLIGSCISPELADLLEVAQRASLPIIFV